MPVKKIEPEKNPAEAAAEEAAADDITVEFRGQTFTIQRATFADARFQLFFAAGRGSDLMLELVGHERADQDRFIGTLQPGEQLVVIAEEFFKAVNDASGGGNS